MKRWSLFVISSLIVVVLSHPQCLDFLPPFSPQSPLSFCYRHSSLACCTASDDAALEWYIEDTLRVKNITILRDHPIEACYGHLRHLVCSQCSPWSQHLYDRGDLHTIRNVSLLHRLPGMCSSYCNKFFNYCSTTTDFLLQLLGDDFPSNVSDYCDNMQRSNDASYCYPFEEDAAKYERRNPETIFPMTDVCVCLKPIVSELRNPLAAVSPADGTKRLFIIEQIGVIRILLNKRLLDKPFLNISSSVVDVLVRGDERGLLGIVFHPKYKTNGRFFVYYMTWIYRMIDAVLVSRVSEFQVSSVDQNVADKNSERIVMSIDQPSWNHNGGQLLFGDDGFLYIFLGDGGSAGDPHGDIGNGQNRSSLLGSVLRIDVDHYNSSHAYSVPSCNPFVGLNNVRTEIFSYGLRNPWRCSFDRGDAITGLGRGQLFCGDVGQNRFEEVDIIEKGGNYGWRGKEGNTCYKWSQCSKIDDEKLPIFAYSHDIGSSVIGGYVYRGCSFPLLRGKYIFGDYSTGRLFTMMETGPNGKWKTDELCIADQTVCHGGLTSKIPKAILSFGEDEDGELYLLAVPRALPKQPDGTVYQIVDPYERVSPELCSTRRSRPVGVHPLPAAVDGDCTIGDMNIEIKYPDPTFVTHD
ncbi:HHIP-like protein 1 [Corticium candelabrum]|uniref:HHIP-like protein 1 n=1 Tax=Corticium candelabrum TaxID=121492 RepID=UPI002E2633BA|nr:HHIP-like protein 1 [Corticium candelabrum]